MESTDVGFKVCDSTNRLRNYIVYPLVRLEW